MTNHAWLVEAARRRNPEITIPPGVAISPDLSEAWAQIVSTFGLSTMDLAAAVAEAYGFEIGSLSQFQPTEGSPLPERLCRQMNLVPLWRDASIVCVATANPRLVPEQISQLGFAAGRPIKFVILPPDDIDTCQTRLFSVPGRSVGEKLRVIDLQGPEPVGDNKHTVRLIRAIFQAALDKNASDVHIHPFVGGGAIRFRVDGLLRRIATIPTDTLEALSRFLKANAGLEANPLKPQDGRLRLKSGKREIDVRLSILPVYDGDRIVCRLLDQSRNFSLQQSHFSAADQLALRRFTSHSAGIVLLTGPTGSGKTSTLYALLAELNSVDVNIMTIENPVEYVLPGISQVQVNDRQGLSFADTLRSILRQDPDIVLIGEIRDGETARIAAQAALTGHLVLATLHTNDALGALPRLLDLGIEGSVLADALIGVVAQRLVRRLCEACRLPVEAPLSASEEEFRRITGELPAYRPAGCPHCEYTGYRGRLPVIEHLESSPELRQELLSGRGNIARTSKTLKGSHRAMAASAKDWIVSGETTPGEVQRVLSIKFWNELAEAHGVQPGMPSLGNDREERAGTRMKILVLSGDTTLTEQLAGAVTYGIARVADENAAVDFMERNGNVIALVIDTALLDTAPEIWLTRLRTKLAWSGLPVLFVAAQENADLRALLEQFHAPLLSGVELARDQLADAVMRLLRGNEQ